MARSVLGARRSRSPRRTERFPSASLHKRPFSDAAARRLFPDYSYSAAILMHWSDFALCFHIRQSSRPGSACSFRVGIVAGEMMPVASHLEGWTARKIFVASLFGRARLKSVIFRYPVASPPPLRQCSPAGEWVMANRSNIRSLFANDPERRERFSYFLHSGCTGLFYVRNEEWLCHG